MEKTLSTSIRYLKGIGPKRALAFNKLGITTLEDLLYYFPRRYEDRTNLSPIAKLTEGSVQTIKAEILKIGERNFYRRRGFNITELTVGDDTGKISCVWFNQPYLKQYFKPGDSLILYGKVERYASRLQMHNPEFELVSDEKDESLNIGRIVPVYSLPERVSQRTLRALIKSVLDEYLPKVQECLSYDIRTRNNLLNCAQSLLNIHFPEELSLRMRAYERLAFEEFLLFQIPLVMRKLRRKEKEGIKHVTEGPLVEGFMESLDFNLTASQEKVLVEIKKDMSKPQVMQRLLQGDVGSGKTVVALLACMSAIQGGYQAALMVPTEILARQHYERIKSRGINVALLSSSIKGDEKDKIYQEIEAGKINLIIGTHALLEEKVKFNNLGLVVIDEQHKFGVGQRALLPKKGPHPDILIMTATPIPRTLAITLYGDLDISVINELPPGRLPIKTEHFVQDERAKAYAAVKEELRKGHQAYIIYPVIEESFALDIAGAKKMYNELKKGEFRDFKLGLVHGKLKQEEQNEVMRNFLDKKVDLLVATTILEVGIDIANATCMVIEHAERFGLSQLHQLRGRVGRGKECSFCFLISDAPTEDASARIKAMVNYSDGFRIAEEDLKIRGPGEFFGHRQHGLTELKIGNPLTQMQLLKHAREEAVRLIDNDPRLQEKQNLMLKDKLLARFPEYEKLIVVG